MWKPWEVSESFPAGKSNPQVCFALMRTLGLPGWRKVEHSPDPVLEWRHRDVEYRQGSEGSRMGWAQESAEEELKYISGLWGQRDSGFIRRWGSHRGGWGRRVTLSDEVQLAAKEGGGILDDPKFLACALRPVEMSWVELTEQQEQVWWNRRMTSFIHSTIWAPASCWVLTMSWESRAEPQSSQAGRGYSEDDGQRWCLHPVHATEEAKEADGSWTHGFGKAVWTETQQVTMRAGKIQGRKFRLLSRNWVEAIVRE